MYNITLHSDLQCHHRRASELLLDLISKMTRDDVNYVEEQHRVDHLLNYS